MTAYHNPDWAECYDLWVRRLFGDSPAEDTPIFEKALKDVCAANPANSNITIIDIGTGSGRVLIDLQTTMHKMPDRRFEVWGIEPSAPMLDRAKKLWDETTEKEKTSAKQNAQSIDGQIQAHWSQSGAIGLVDKARLGQKADLVIFAAGGFSHLTDDKDIRVFLKELHRVLKPDGRAVISILRDYMPEADDLAFTTFGANDKEPDPKLIELMSKPHRIPSQEHNGVIYVKHPALQTQNKDIKTETFRLEVEDVEGNTLRSHELSWDAKMFDALLVLDWMRDEAGLKLTEVIEGEIQIWWILEKTQKNVYAL